MRSVKSALGSGATIDGFFFNLSRTRAIDTGDVLSGCGAAAAGTGASGGAGDAARGAADGAGSCACTGQPASVTTTVPSAKELAKMPERGARLASRDDRESGEYLRKEQRRQAGCPARQVGKLFRTRDTSSKACIRTYLRRQGRTASL